MDFSHSPHHLRFGWNQFEHGQIIFWTLNWFIGERKLPMYGRFGHLSTKITIISKHYYSLNTWSFSNLKTELCRGRLSTTFDKTEFWFCFSLSYNINFHDESFWLDNDCTACIVIDLTSDSEFLDQMKITVKFSRSNVMWKLSFFDHEYDQCWWKTLKTLHFYT